MSGEKILVIDDRRENLLFLANSVLRPEGYQVITATDGKQGLDKALAEKPNLIITDLKMPRMSGLELMAALRQAGSDIPVILTTFYGSEQAAIQAFRLGAKDYIIKPYEIKDMLDSVERSLVEHRLRRESKDLQTGVQVGYHLEERVRQLHSLCGIGKAILALHERDAALRVMVEAAIYLTGADSGQLFLINFESRSLELRAVRGPSDSRARCVRQVGADRLTLQAAKTGKTLLADRGSGGRYRVPRLVVPLRSGERVIGVLAVDAKRDQAFNDNDRYLMGLLADFAAISMVNIYIVDDLRKQLAKLSNQPPAAADGWRPAAQAALAEGKTEAEQLSAELQRLASVAHELASKLQMPGDG